MWIILQVDIYVMTTPPNGEWILYGTDLTDNAGRLTFTIPKEKALALGIYPVKMVVRCTIQNSRSVLYRVLLIG